MPTICKSTIDFGVQTIQYPSETAPREARIGVARCEKNEGHGGNHQCTDPLDLDRSIKTSWPNDGKRYWQKTTNGRTTGAPKPLPPKPPKPPKPPTPTPPVPAPPPPVDGPPLPPNLPSEKKKVKK